MCALTWSGMGAWTVFGAQSTHPPTTQLANVHTQSTHPFTHPFSRHWGEEQIGKDWIPNLALHLERDH